MYNAHLNRAALYIADSAGRTCGRVLQDGQAAGQLTSIDDTRRGHIEYRYDPIGRLLAANSAMGHETFAFDPAGNIQVPNTAQQYQSIATRAPLPKVLDNLLKEYAGTSYRYDDRGNLIERRQNGQRDTFEWDAFNRMARAITRLGVTTFAYDPLGRRIAKHGQATGGTTLRKSAHTMYGWDGDTLALESSVHYGHAHHEQTVHYVYERGSFVPLVQATRHQALQLAPTTDIKALMAGNDGRYDIALDPLWNGEYEQEAEPFETEKIAFYQCDQLGTPQELTDCEGKVAWSAQYKAWGKAKEAISDAAYKAGIRSLIRFQGQYLDDETGLHYNRFRYYDPISGRFVSRDPIGLVGGLNSHQYAPNPTGWIDPSGLQRCRVCPQDCERILEEMRKSGRDFGPYSKVDPDSHHIIQDAAVRDLPGYSRSSAPAVQLLGPSTKIGSEHYTATQTQRQAGGGDYASERRIGYKAMRRAGLNSEQSRCLIMGADAHFSSIGVSGSTTTRIPGNRK
ncbi:RHS repeat-associated core domain-containing protein [Massilia sp. YMA4]|uniref:RHS repeat-associated core domain-containing protein n=1 Tax=[Empedobacter] haloabium TaxID=592317 RepID=A0ABZ1URV2_9BURK|nr:RHS repeat-associated core domain-containing protein [Massilia sp. YMA4]